MFINSEQEAVSILLENNVEIVNEDILFPRHGHFIEEVHEAIEFLIERCFYGIKYV